jgi:ssDNA-binding Zn-finger/Zn-ribbon topoisomerase 1
MHTQPMSESSGTLNPAKESDRKCKKCGSTMMVQIWESSCGGYEDEKYSCSNSQCGYSFWIDGCDS